MLSVRMLKEWEYDFVDVHGEIATRKCPRGLVLEFDEEVAASAVASGSAETMQPHSAEFAEKVRVHKRFFDILAEVGDPDEAMAILSEQEAARAAESEKATSKPRGGKKKSDGDADAKAKDEADAAAAT